MFPFFPRQQFEIKILLFWRDSEKALKRLFCFNFNGRFSYLHPGFGTSKTPHVICSTGGLFLCSPTYPLCSLSTLER